MTTSNELVAHKLAYSINETIAATSIKKTTLYKLLADPDCPLKAIRIGGRTIIRVESIREFLDQAELADA